MLEDKAEIGGQRKRWSPETQCAREHLSTFSLIFQPPSHWIGIFSPILQRKKLRLVRVKQAIHEPEFRATWLILYILESYAIIEEIVSITV